MIIDFHNQANQIENLPIIKDHAHNPVVKETKKNNNNVYP
jgi:hypothetical protein